MKRLVWVFVVAALTGCSSSRSYVPKDAFTDSTKTVSVEHPYQDELRQESLDKQGKGEKITITSFEVVIDPGMLCEGKSFGVYPAVALMSDAKKLEGYVVIAPDAKGNLPMTPDCQVLGRVFFEATIEQLNQAKILVANNDFGWVYTLNGFEVPIQGNQDLAGSVVYDPKKYDNDSEYRKILFYAYGRSLQENEDAWRQYYEKHQARFQSSIYSVVVGSPDWPEYRRAVLQSLPKVYQMPNGEFRIGYLPKDDFGKVATELTDSNLVLKVFKEFGINLGMLAASFTGAGAVMPAVGFAGQVTSAAIDTKNYESFSSRAFAQRHDLAPALRLVLTSCQNKNQQQ